MKDRSTVLSAALGLGPAAASIVAAPVAVAAHETGHVRGLPDDYSGPCSELMSGGGPGPSCTHRYPDANERARVDRLWANGLTR